MCIFHSLVVGLYPFIAVLEFNWNDVYLSELLDSIPFALAVLVVLLIVWRLLTRSLSRASVGTTVTYLMILAYGPFARWWRGDKRVPGSGMVDLHFQSKEVVAFVIFAACIAALLILLRRSRDQSISFAVKILNYFAIVLIIMSLGSIAQKAYQESALKFPLLPITREVTFQPSDSKPNIYYIIVDGYGGEGILRRIYNTSPVLGENLRRLNFYVAEDAHSNYFRTNYSLVSSLNMSYLNPPLIPESISKMGFSYLRRRLQHNAVRQILEDAGYRTLAFETGYRSTEWKDATEYFPLTPWNRILATSASYVQLPYIREFISRELHALHRERIERIFPALLAEASTPGPKFVFAHIIAPHPPFVYEQDGSLYVSHKVFTLGDGDDYGGAADYLDRYRAQLEYISTRISAFLNELRKLDPDSYIIIQGDHGPGFHFDSRSLDATDVRERFSILSAYYFPRKDYEELYPTITPVNSFRVILNKLTKANLPLLPDRSFFAEARTPLSFIDVTDQLHHEK